MIKCTLYYDLSSQHRVNTHLIITDYNTHSQEIIRFKR